MITWKNLDTVSAYQELQKVAPVNLTEAMAGENGADRVRKYSVPMAAGLAFHYAARQVDDKILEVLGKLAEETQLAEKFEALYNREVINTGEKRMVLHHMTRGQLGEAVVADGVDKRDFYMEQQRKIAELANKVHSGEITNAAGEKFTTVVQIGIGGSDLGPRAMYLALENWARVNNTFKMEARFISNVDPDDAAAVLNTIDVAHSLFVLVSKSGTTLETLTNESFVKDALKNAGLDASRPRLWQRATTIWRHSLWMTISAAGFPPPPVWAVRYCLWRLARRYLPSSWRVRQRRTGWHRTGMYWQIPPCWTP